MDGHSRRLPEWLVHARWLDAARARAWSRIFLVMAALAAIAWVALSDGIVDRSGKPLGTDFASFYAASRLILDGMPAAAWDPARHFAAQIAVFGRDAGYYAFFYPPPYALLVAPLALLPYGWALLSWLATTTLAAVLVLRSWARGLVDLLSIVSLPVLWLNAGHGQNAALTTAVMGLGGLLLDRAPVLSGLVLGTLVIKPQLAVALPVALALARRWKAFVATGASALVWCAASWLVLGPEAWHAFLASGDLARRTMEEGLVASTKMQSLFAGTLTLGGPVWLGYALQAIAALVALGILGRVAAARPDGRALIAMTAAATMLVSPFMLDYDLLLAALPMAWLLAEAGRTGFRPFERILLLALAVIPFVGRGISALMHLPLAPFLMFAFLILLSRRIRTEQAAR